MFKSKECRNCKNDFVPTGPAAVWCPECALLKRRENARNRTQEYRRRKGVKVGVGKGGAQPKGKDSPHYRTGISIFMRYSKILKETVNSCQRCFKDLSGTKPSEWACHHKDRDRTNNVPENFELLCKQCHQIEHECIKALQSATTTVIRLPNGRYARDAGSAQEGSKRTTSSIEDDDIV